MTVPENIKVTVVEPRNSVLQNSGKTRISGQFSNDQKFLEKIFCPEFFLAIFRRFLAKNGLQKAIFSQIKLSRNLNQ